MYTGGRKRRYCSARCKNAQKYRRKLALRDRRRRVYDWEADPLEQETVTWPAFEYRPSLVDRVLGFFGR